MNLRHASLKAIPLSRSLKLVLVHKYMVKVVIVPQGSLDWCVKRPELLCIRTAGSTPVRLGSVGSDRKNCLIGAGDWCLGKIGNVDRVR